MAVWALLSISQTVKAADVTVYFQCPDGPDGWNTPVCAYAYNSNTDHASGWFSAPAGSVYYTSTGVKLWKCTFDSKYKYVIFKEPADGEKKVKQYPDGQGFEVHDKYVYTFGGTSGTSLSEFENGGTTPSEFTKLYVWGDISGSAWGENDFSREFTTSDGKTYKYVFGTDYTNGFSNNTEDFCFRVKTESKQYAPPTNDDPVGTEYTSAKESSEGAWKLTMTKGKSYTLIFDYENKQIMYSEEGSGIVPPPTPSGENPIANRKYSEGYYLVGNFFNFDGDNINYNDAVFKFQQQKDDADGNAVYMVEIPATLTAKAQVMSVDATGTPNAVYGPTKGYATIDNTHPVVGEDHTAKLGPEALVESTKISEDDDNFWNMRSRRTLTTEGGQDGSYTYYITIDKDTKKPSLWTIKYDDMKRVAYYLSTDEKATAMTLTSVRTNIIKLNEDSGNFNGGKFQGTLYSKDGSEFYAISNAMCQIEEIHKDYVFEKYRNQVVDTKNILSTYPKLFLWGNGGKTLSESANQIAATNGTFKLNNGIVGISSWEFNSNKGNNDYNKLWGNTGGEVLQKSTHKIITSLSLVGTAIPGTTTADGEWNWASDAADMEFDVSENCYKATIVTTGDNTNKPFRFVGNHKQEINWFENSNEDQAEMAAKYNNDGKFGVGHTASPSDPNEISYTESGLTVNAGEDYHINWNRPAGTWTVRFYIYTYSQDGNNPSYRYFYTINKNSNLELRDFKDVVYMSEENVRNIKGRDNYQYFRTWSDDTAWKRPKNVDVFVVSEVTAADANNQVGIKLKNINNFDTSEDVIPANTGVILALKENVKVPGAVFHKRKSLITYNTLDIQLEQAKNKDLRYSGDNLLVSCFGAKNIPTADEKNVNYLFGFYHAIHGLGLDNASDKKGYNQNDYLMGFWISNGKGLTYANSSYLPIEKAKAEKLNLGTSNDFKALQDQPGSAKKIPALFFDFSAVDNDVTGIQGVVESKTVLDGKYYTLSGQQVEHPTVGGIYIHNGKKYVIK